MPMTQIDVITRTSLNHGSNQIEAIAIEAEWTATGSALLLIRDGRLEFMVQTDLGGAEHFCCYEGPGSEDALFADARQFAIVGIADRVFSPFLHNGGDTDIKFHPGRWVDKRSKPLHDPEVEVTVEIALDELSASGLALKLEREGGGDFVVRPHPDDSDTITLEWPNVVWVPRGVLDIDSRLSEASTQSDTRKQLAHAG